MQSRLAENNCWTSDSPGFLNEQEMEKGENETLELGLEFPFSDSQPMTQKSGLVQKRDFPEWCVPPC